MEPETYVTLHETIQILYLALQKPSLNSGDLVRVCVSLENIQMTRDPKQVVFSDVCDVELETFKSLRMKIFQHLSCKLC